MLQICEVDYTYQSLINGQQSCLDHFVISQNLISSITKYSVLHDGDNFSDHDVVTLKLSLSIDNIRDISAFVGKPLWHKATEQHLERYRCNLDILLSKICVPKIAVQCDNNFCSEHCELLEEYHDNIIAACLDASSCIPMSRQNRSNCIPGWNEFVKVYKDKALFWHKLWKEGGSPTSGVLFDLRRKTRYEYHRALRFVKRNAKNIRATRMAADLANNNKKNFWAELKRIIGRSSSLPSTVDDIVGADDIAELFHTKYDSLYNSVSYDTQEMAALTNEIESSIRCQSLTWNRINVDDIRHAINLIKAGKHDGLTGHCSDHIKNGTHMLHTHMSLLFNVMISHGFAPGGFRLATLIPIPKNKIKSLNKSSNYRAVALSSILGKVLDHIFLIKYSDILFSSELQYGFKKKHSTTQCTFVVNE
jgi:hypothetical protein